MNIFILDNDIKTSVQYHIDSHVVKITLEAAQLLATAARVNEILGFRPRYLEKNERLELNKHNFDFYKASYVNHPCAIWARSSSANYEYLLDYVSELETERKHRFPKGVAVSKSYETVQRMPQKLSKANVKEPTPFVQCMLDEYKGECAIEAYRCYYLAEKQFDKNGKSMAKWTNRNPPEWWF